jgi:Mrp family chromosome partitioning ATPase
VTTHLSGGEERALGPYRRAIGRHPWLVALVTLASVAASIAWLSMRPAEYQATAQVLVTPVAGDAATAGLPILTESVDPTRTLQTAASVLVSPRAAALAAQRLGGGRTPADVITDVAVEPQGDSNIVAVTATAPDAQLAARIANAYALGALAARREALGRQVDAQLAGVEARRKALGSADAATAADLGTQATRLQAIRDGQDPNFSLLQTADVPDATIGAPAWMVVALALIGGFALGTGAALAIEYLDRRVRDEEELATTLSLPVLARVPRQRQPSGGASLPPGPRVLEAFRALQIQLEARAGQGPRVIMVTSASEGDGKTTSAIALAKTLASSGGRVVLLDFDLRKGDVGERLDAYTDLLGLLRGATRLSAALVAAPGVRGLRVLSAPPAGDTESLLATLSRRLPDLIIDAREEADYVVVDTPPLGRVADALRLMAYVDELLLVARPGHTTRQELAIVHEMLEHLAVVPTGLIVFGASRRTRVGGYYGFDGEPRQPRVPLSDVTASPARTNGDRRPARALAPPA